MNATISMDGLWSAIQSLSIKNKKWLADKLLCDIKAAETSKSKEEILVGIERGLKDIKEDRVYPIDQLWDQL